jgi:hypothetical protein
MTERRKRRVAHTEDRIQYGDPVCAYQQCQGRLSAAQIADGWTTCSEECEYERLMELHEDNDPQEDDE